MKNILLFVIATILVCLNCKAQNGYQATGTVKGFDVKNLNVVAYRGSVPDTLAKVPIVDGRFQFVGNVKQPIVAYLIFEGARSGFQIFLENNASYTITFDNSSPAANHVEGGPVQKLFNEYRAILLDVMNKQQLIQKQLNEASFKKDTVLREQLKKYYRDAYLEYQSQLTDFLAKNADTYVAAYVVVSMMNTLKIDQLKEHYAKLGKNAKKTDMGQLIADRIEKTEQLAIGQVAPNFKLTTPNGKKVSLHSIKGKVKLVDFWASWCGPCRNENPNVMAIYNEFHDKGLEIIGISLDDKKELWTKAIADDKLTWYQVSDLKGVTSDVARLYDVTSVPRTFLLDENNRIVGKNLRGDELKAKIAELLK